MANPESPDTQPAVVAWVRAHLLIVVGAAVGLLLVLIVVVVLLLTGGSSGGGRAVAAGSIVGTQPLTSGYRVVGTVKARGPDSVTLVITRVDSSAGEARNVVLRPGATMEFDRPAAGTVAVARNGHEISGPAKLHNGDTVTLVGQFTSVLPSPAHDGYCFLGIEASSK